MDTKFCYILAGLTTPLKHKSSQVWLILNRLGTLGVHCTLTPCFVAILGFQRYVRQLADLRAKGMGHQEQESSVCTGNEHFDVGPPHHTGPTH